MSRPEPELDWVDVAVHVAWARLADDLCPGCGRLKAEHEGQTPADFHTGYDECPAVAALDAAQAERHAEADDKAAAEQGLNPERSRFWVTWTDAEGTPTA